MAYRSSDLGLTSWLPVEVYHIFLTFSLPEHLPSIALVSRTFAAEAQRVLFKDIRIASMPKLIQLLRILASRPVLAAYVRVLVISCGIIEPELLRAFYTLLSRALNQTRNLAMLDLPFFSPHSKFLLGSSVRLDEFRTGMDWDADFSRWLAEQDKLRFLNFYGVRCGPWELSEDALRDLCFIGGPPSVLKRVIPGRPITAVHVRVSGPFQLEADSLSQVAEAIASSSATVTYASVQVQYNGVRSEEDFMLDRHTVVAAFNALASALSSVTTLFFMPGRIFVDQDLLLAMGDFMEHLPCLQRFAVLAHQEHESLQEYSVVHEIAEVWHAKCKTLEVVHLSEHILVHDPRFGWIDSKAAYDSVERYKIFDNKLNAYFRSSIELRWW